MCEPSDRREVQEHHCEWREPGFKEEDQRANIGETEYPHFSVISEHLNEDCLSACGSLHTHIPSLYFLLSAG